MPITNDREIADILRKAKKIAVIGLSPVPARPSYGVTRYLIEAGYEIFGIRPASPPKILGRPAFESLADLKEDVDIIDVFRNSEALTGVVDEVAAWIASGRKTPIAIWLQEGVSNAEAEMKAEKIGLKVIVSRCILKEHARLL